MDFFEKLFDKATGVVDRIIDYEFSNFELDLIRKAQADEAERNAAQLPAQFGGSSNTLVLVGLGLLLVVGVLALRKK